eukprot:COSAG01_NODE_9_length_43729_cov_66.133463_26_plen_317_part_00
MKNTKSLDLSDIQQKIKHRFENLLLDRAIMNLDETQGKFYLQVNEDDDLDRHIFFRQKEAGKRCLLSAFFLEILALGSIVITDQVSSDDLVVFAGAANFKKTGDIYLGESIHGEVVRVGEKGGFHKYTGVLSNEAGEAVFSGEMTAFYVKDTHDIEAPTKASEHQIVMGSCVMHTEKDELVKANDLYISDGVYRVADDEAWGRYAFPVSHICNKGHFPGNPLLMGVLQLTAIEDTILLWLKQQNKQGELNIKGHANLMKPDGSAVAQIKFFELSAYIGVAGILDQCELKNIKKIGFKQPVRPGDTMLIQLSKLTVT